MLGGNIIALRDLQMGRLQLSYRQLASPASVGFVGCYEFIQCADRVAVQSRRFVELTALTQQPTQQLTVIGKILTPIRLCGVKCNKTRCETDSLAGVMGRCL